MPRSYRLLVARVCAAALVLFASSPARSVFLAWNNPLGGSADAAANWNPVRVPAAADQLGFGIVNAYTVTFPSPIDSVSMHLFSFGNVTLDCTAPHYGRDFFLVGSGALSNATVTLTNGNFRAGKDARIGDGAGAVGVMRVNGASSSLTHVGGAAEFPVGRLGNGTLEVASGGQVSPAADLVIGEGFGGVGRVTVSGETTLPAWQRSQLVFVDGPFGLYSRIGYAGGTGTLEVLNGGLYQAFGSVLAGRSPNDTGTILVGGVAYTDSARLDIHGDFALSSGTGAGQPGGTSTCTVDSNGVVSVTSRTTIGCPGTGSGTLKIHDKGRLITHSLTWDKEGGDLDFPGGLLQINGGDFTVSDQRFKFNSNVNTPVLELMNGATANFNGAGIDTPLVVGVKGNARLRVLSGSTLASTFGNTLLGQESGSLGQLIARDGSTLDITDMHVGRDGRGEYRLFSGATASHHGVIVGERSGTGIMEVRGPGTAVDAQFMYLPFFSATGTGDVTIGSGGRIDLSSTGVHSNLSVNGTLHIEAGGTLSFATNYYLNGGLLDLLGGTITATAPLELTGGGSLIGEGDVDAPVSSTSDTTGIITATGPLFLGPTGSGTSGFHFKGVMNVGADTVTIRDSGLSDLGDVSMSGGLLALPASGARLPLSRELSGRGTVSGPLATLGQVRATGAAGLRFAGLVTGTGHAMLGTKFTFLGGSTFAGAGALAPTSVQFDSLSNLVATGDLVVGAAAGAATPVLQGRIFPGASRIEFVSPSDVVLGDVVEFGGGNGRIAFSGAAPQFVVAADGVLRGRGTVEGNTVSVGRLAPGAPLGRLRFVGDLGTSGTCECEAGGAGGVLHDTLVVTGAATLGGTLNIVPLAGFTAVAGDSFKVLQCGSRVGKFTSVLYGGGSSAGVLEAHYVADGVWIVIKAGTLDVQEGGGVLAGGLRFAAVGSPGPDAVLELTLPGAAEAVVRLYDVTGREVARVHDGALAAGTHRLSLRGEALPAGVLFARAEIRDASGTRTRAARVVVIH